jgi:hypothetical protein
MPVFLSRSRGVAAALSATAWWLATGAVAASAQPVAYGGAGSFAVLASSSVTNTGASVVGGDVGVGPGGTVTGVTAAMLTNGGALHVGDAVAAQALHDARVAWTALGTRTCPMSNRNPGLDGASLAPGVYCFSGDAVLTTTLTLTGTGPWIFQVDGALTIGPGATIVAPLVGSNTCRGSDVHWKVGDAAPGTPITSVSVGAGASMVGTIVAEGAVSFGAAAALDGRAVSLGAPAGGSGGGVTLNANTAFAACSFGQPLPVAPGFKVTGGGGINVPSDPTITDPEATGTGFANYGFNAQPDAAPGSATGRFNYVNHAVNGNLHLNGPVTAVQVLTLNGDGTPKTVRIAGTCDGFLPACTFSVEAEDNGEPGFNDRFGVTVVSSGQVVEARAIRTVRNGNLQFHSAALTTTVSAPALRTGDTMRLRARLRKDRAATPSDAYLVLQLPNGQLLSWTTAGLVPGLVPLVRNFVPVDFDGDVLALPIPAGAPPGAYVWLSALTRAGTLELLSGIAQRSFTIAP